MTKQPSITEFLALRRNTVLLLAAMVLAGTGERLWLGFAPKYLETLGASVLVIGLFDALQTFLGAVYAYPGGWERAQGAGWSAVELRDGEREPLGWSGGHSRTGQAFISPEQISQPLREFAEQNTANQLHKVPKHFIHPASISHGSVVHQMGKLRARWSGKFGRVYKMSCRQPDSAYSAVNLNQGTAWRKRGRSSVLTTTTIWTLKPYW